MSTSVVVGTVILLSGVWAVLAGSGRNLSCLGDEAFAQWHGKFGRTMKMLGGWGLFLGSVFLIAGVVS